MTTIRLVSGAAAAAVIAVAAHAQEAPPPPPLPPPPIVTTAIAPPPGAARNANVARWTPGEVRCGDRRGEAVAMRLPELDLAPATASANSAVVTLQFDIGADGRPLSVTRLGMPWPDSGRDLVPSLAASRFVPGPSETCIVRYSASLTPFAQADLGDVLELSLRRSPLGIPAEGRERVLATFQCMRANAIRPISVHYPESVRVSTAPGTRGWTFVTFDVGADGVPTGVRIAGGSRDPVFDAAAIEAVSQDRYAGGPRTGCLRPFGQTAQTLEAPPVDGPEWERREPPNCASADSWASKPRMIYPAAYRARAIDGWAKLTYDVTPEGAITNVRVVESQPTVDFGRQASGMVKQAKRKPLEKGATGCRVLVRYKMSDPSPSPEVTAPAT